MTKTRSKDQLNVITMRYVEETIELRFKAMTESLEKDIAGMIERSNERFNKRMADLLEAIRLVSVNKGIQDIHDEASTARSRLILASPHVQNPILAKPNVQNPTVSSSYEIKSSIKRDYDARLEEGLVKKAILDPQTQHLDQVKDKDDSQLDYQGMTRISKLDFPRFNGEKVQEWLFKADQFFSIDTTPPILKISIASIHLGGIAATWHQSLVKIYDHVFGFNIEVALSNEVTRINHVWDPGGVIAKQVYGDCSNKIFLLNLEVKVLSIGGDLLQENELKEDDDVVLRS